MFDTEMEKQPAWWALLMVGVSALGVGVMFLKAPASSVLALTVVLGAYWLARGIIGLVGVGFGPPITIGWRLFASLVSIAAGLFVLVYPHVSAGLLPLVYVIVMGVDALISGGVYIYTGLVGGGAGSVVLGFFDIIVGVLLLWQPNLVAPVVPFVFGWLFIIGGVALVAVCLSLRSQQHKALREASAI